VTTVLTYGTFDLFHVGHLSLLERLSEVGDRLIVGVSTDEFNALKGKKTVIPFGDRCRIVAGLRCVDLVIPENSWEQKVSDIQKHRVSIFGMGEDWTGKFDELREHCDVVYLPRTPGVSTTTVKTALNVLGKSQINELKQALDIISAIVDRFD